MWSSKYSSNFIKFTMATFYCESGYSKPINTEVSGLRHGIQQWESNSLLMRRFPVVVYHVTHPHLHLITVY